MSKLQQPLPFTVLKQNLVCLVMDLKSTLLQQPLPFTVLKHFSCYTSQNNINELQQPLPFTVLKR